MSSSDPLPARPDLDQLRRRAKELRDAARSGDPAALSRIAAHSPAGAPVTLAAAQLAIAREHGFASWPRLKAEAQARNTELARRVDEFLVASIRDWTGRAARMLARDPQIAGYDFRTAVILGDAARVRAMLARDPELATRPDSRTGWTALHAVCSSRWNRLDPARAEGLTEVARLLLDAGANPVQMIAPGRPGGGGDRRFSTLFCAVAGANNPAITRLLLERGARPDNPDELLYLAAFPDDHECLRLLLPHMPDIAQTMALAAPLSTGDLAGVQILLDAGADPNRLLDAGLLGESHEGEPATPPLSAAIELECDPAIIGLLLDRGADPGTPGPDGRIPYQLAIRKGQAQIAELLAGYGAPTELTATDRFLSACRQARRAEAERILAADPGLPGRLTAEDHRVLIEAADHGHTDAVRLMLDLGFPLDTRADPKADGATALHAAAAAGSPAAVRLLLERGADLQARDTTWNDTPLGWACVGSGLHLGHAPDPDWVAAVRTLLEAGASTEGMVLSPDDAKPPSPEVARLLRSYGVPDREEQVT